MKTTAWTRTVMAIATTANLPDAVTTHLVAASAQDLRERGGALLAASLGPGEGAEFLAAHRYAVEHPGLEDVDGLQPHEVWTRRHLPDGVVLLEAAAAEIVGEIEAGPYQYLARHPWDGVCVGVGGDSFRGGVTPCSRVDG